MKGELHDWVTVSRLPYSLTTKTNIDCTQNVLLVNLHICNNGEIYISYNLCTSSKLQELSYYAKKRLFQNSFESVVFCYFFSVLILSTNSNPVHTPSVASQFFLCFFLVFCCLFMLIHTIVCYLIYFFNIFFLRFISKSISIGNG